MKRLVVLALVAGGLVLPATAHASVNALYGTRGFVDDGPGTACMQFSVSVDTGTPELRGYAKTFAGSCGGVQSVYVKEVKLVENTGQVVDGTNHVYAVWMDVATHTWTSNWSDQCGGGTFTGYGRIVYKILWNNGTVTGLLGHNSFTVTKSYCA